MQTLLFYMGEMPAVLGRIRSSGSALPAVEQKGIAWENGGILDSHLNSFKRFFTSSL